MASYSVCYGGGRVFAGGITSRAAAEVVAARCRGEHGSAAIVPERADSCRGCGKATQQAGRLCETCEDSNNDE